MRFKIVLIVAGGVLLFIGYKEFALSSSSNSEPQPMTLADLAENGPGENAHVVVGDFLLCSFCGYVYEGETDGGAWKTVWIPAVALDGPYHTKVKALVGPDGSLPDEVPPPDDIRVIVKATGSLTKKKIDVLGNQDTLQGMIVNKIESLDSEEKRLLAESYRGIDFDKCWILHVGRKPAGFGKIAGLLGGGLALVLLGGGLLLAGRRKSQAAEEAPLAEATPSSEETPPAE